jgi:acyl dehydratase
MAYVINALNAWTGDPACVRSIRVRFLSPVYAGERVTVEGAVTDVAGDEATCELWLNADGRRALSARAVVTIPDPIGEA